MLRTRRIRAAALVAIVISTVGFGVAQPAQATAEATAAETTATKPGVISRLQPLTVTQVTSEQVRDMAAKGDGQLITLQSDAGIANVITCYLTISLPYGGGAPNANVLIDAIVACDGLVHLASLAIDLWRDTNLVASGNATFPYTYGVAGTVGVTGCTAGIYWGSATAMLTRFDFFPPTVSRTVYSFPAGIGCGSPPPPPPPPSPAPSPVDAYFVCGTGSSTIFCDVRYSGTVGGVAIRWYVDGAHWSNYDNSVWISIGCSTGQIVRIRAVVSASNGTDESIGTMSCASGPPDW